MFFAFDLAQMCEGAEDLKIAGYSAIVVAGTKFFRFQFDYP
jgi:predicted N-acetyltransferase YhbS